MGTIKEIPGVRTYVSVDGGMSDNIRPMLYDAHYEGMLANKAERPADTRVTVAGKHCESGDILIRDAVLARPEPGDILVMPATGAYCFAMSSNYNGNPRPAVVLVNEGQARVIIERETLRGPGGEAPSAARERATERRGRGMGRDRVVRIGLLGFGTIGSSVYRLIQKEHDQILEGTGVDLQVAKVLEIDPSKRPADVPAELFTADFAEIVDDPSIDIVVEVIGGTSAAFDFLDAAMRKGKNVVTANKQLLATRGEALFTLARDEQRHLRFEASVAGAIPIIKVMRESMIAAGLHTVYGIVNGTTNYILTRMYNDEGDYADILGQGARTGLRRGRPHRRRGRGRRRRQDGHPRLDRLPLSGQALATWPTRASRTSLWTTSGTPRTSVSSSSSSVRPG